MPVAIFERRWLAECESTNALGLDHLREGGAPLLLVADRQTNGRGRQGRSWISIPGGSLTCSFALALPARLDLSGLSLAVGCAVADALDPSGGHIRLKWPNDLWLDGAKLGGILIETIPLPDAQRGVVIGLGLNLAPLPLDADRSAYASGHAALTSLWPEADADAVLARLAPALRHLLSDFEDFGGFGPWQRVFAKRDLARGQVVRVGTLVGTARGVNGHGDLLLQTASGLQVCRSGELSLRLEE
ncbi:biotin--[acetyl-CoA-carboxylase] ligase [Roseateles paludis]|uniref:Biotin--[acetyl-CoA-carboxylase] ligase n=1 Tax=Roseateles paludis TaxID=3145238 RepID=A0ABV0FZ73_9BURK